MCRCVDGEREREREISTVRTAAAERMSVNPLAPTDFPALCCRIQHVYRSLRSVYSGGTCCGLRIVSIPPYTPVEMSNVCTYGTWWPVCRYVMRSTVRKCVCSAYSTVAYVPASRNRKGAPNCACKRKISGRQISPASMHTDGRVAPTSKTMRMEW
jgi:hypothetical protein